MLMLATEDSSERRAIAGEAEELLALGSLSHNHIAFRHHAIEACLNFCEYDEAEGHARALAAYCPEEPSPHARFISGRGEALARFGRGEHSRELAAEIDRLIIDGERLGQKLALAALRAAQSKLQRS